MLKTLGTRSQSFHRPQDVVRPSGGDRVQVEREHVTAHHSAGLAASAVSDLAADEPADVLERVLLRTREREILVECLCRSGGRPQALT